MIENENLPALPSSWIWVKLNEITTIASGGTPSTKDPKNFGGEIPWITPADLSNYKEKYIEKGGRNITELGLNTSSVTLLPKGTIIFSSRAPIGYVAIAKNEVTTNQRCKNFIPSKAISNEYLYYYLKGNKSLAESYASGTTFLELSARRASRIPVPLPPILEQKRMVAKIEELFTKLDVSVEDLNSIKKKFYVYRKSVLKAAFDGKLIELKDGVINTTLSDEFEIIMGQSPESTHYNKNEEGLPFFQGKKEFTNLYAEIQQWSRKTNKIAEKDDVLLSVRAPIGPVNLAPSKCGIGRGLAAIKPNSKTNSKLIFYLLKIHEVELERRGTGTTFRAITKPRLYSLPITLPKSEDDRASLLQEIESRFSVINKLEKTVDTALNKTEKLRKSILKSAFEGKLVSQDPTDEPAEVLLKRIKK